MSLPPSRPVVARRRRAIAIAGAILLATLTLREAWRAATREREVSPSLDARFAAFLPLVKGEARVGYVDRADDRHEAMTRRVEIQYALAPAVLVSGAEGFRLVVGWADGPTGLDELARLHRLHALLRTPDGYALFERAGP